jgi:hypothetical protein
MGKFGWPDATESAFQELKTALTTTPTLAMLNFNEPFTIESDASGNDIGVVLSQQGQPISFMSRFRYYQTILVCVCQRNVNHHSCNSNVETIFTRKEVLHPN